MQDGFARHIEPRQHEGGEIAERDTKNPHQHAHVEAVDQRVAVEAALGQFKIAGDREGAVELDAG